MCSVARNEETLDETLLAALVSGHSYISATNYWSNYSLAQNYVMITNDADLVLGQYFQILV